MTLELGRTINVHEIQHADLEAEAWKFTEADTEFEACRICSERADGQYDHNEGELLFIPSLQRAGIARGADAQWTDATSAQDALDRYNDGTMAN